MKFLLLYHITSLNNPAIHARLYALCISLQVKSNAVAALPSQICNDVSTPPSSLLCCLHLHPLVTVIPWFGIHTERVGFEPTVHCCTQTFEICTLSRSDTSPYFNCTFCRKTHITRIFLLLKYSFEISHSCVCIYNNDG